MHLFFLMLNFGATGASYRRNNTVVLHLIHLKVHEPSPASLRAPACFREDRLVRYNDTWHEVTGPGASPRPVSKKNRGLPVPSTATISCQFDLALGNSIRRRPGQARVEIHFCSGRRLVTEKNFFCVQVHRVVFQHDVSQLTNARRELRQVLRTSSSFCVVFWWYKFHIFSSQANCACNNHNDLSETASSGEMIVLDTSQ